jgi:hypothetical protein
MIINLTCGDALRTVSMTWSSAGLMIAWDFFPRRVADAAVGVRVRVGADGGLLAVAQRPADLAVAVQSRARQKYIGQPRSGWPGGRLQIITPGN